jgi:hypothetical protein
VRQLYGFAFPEDLFSFWEFANRVRPLEPLQAFVDVNGLHLVGPFDVLAGRFDHINPRYPLSLHWRYHDDPPEFFTVLAGGEDGFHRGYYLDDPAHPRSCVSSYFAKSRFELVSEGDSLFDVVRLDLERRYRDLEENTDPAQRFECEMSLRQLDSIRTRLMQFATQDRPATGAAYEESFPEGSSRVRDVVAATRDGMGVVVAPGQYRPLSLKDKALWRRLRQDEDPVDLVNEARDALRAGYPGTALKLGKDLWAFGGDTRDAYAFELLDAAYADLRRGVLRDVLRQHRENRDLPSVDILEVDSSQ